MQKEQSQQQLTLPYEEITKIANRDYLRKNFTVSGRVAYKIPFEQIEEREGFNKRKIYDEIEELAQSILLNGLKEPFVLDILQDGRAIVEQGHRRRRAIQLLIDKKEKGWTKKTEVEFFPNKSEVTELHRVINQLTSNNLKKKLKPFEAADVAYDVKHNFSVKPKSNEEVAELMGISRQQVDNYILIATADDVLKNEMVMADMNLTDCISLLRKKKKLEKQGDDAELNSHKNSAAPTPSPKDELADEMKELGELDKQSEQMKKDTGEVRMTNPELKEYESKGLDLVGNSIASNGKDENDVPGAKKFDETREEIKQVQNCIKLADKLEAIVEKLDVPEGTKKDVSDIVKWLQKDLDEVRSWIHKNKKQNKAR